MAQYRIPLEIFQKARLLEWLNRKGLDTSVAKRLLRSSRVERSDSINYPYSYLFHRLSYGDILREMRTQDIIDYLQQAHAMNIKDFSRAEVLDKEYEDSDTEGLVTGIKDACLREFGEEGYYPSESLMSLIETLERRAIRIVDGLRKRDQVIELLGGNRIDTEKYLKILAHFCCLIDTNLNSTRKTWRNFENLKTTPKLWEITLYLRSFNPGTLFERNVLEHIENLQRILGQTIDKDQEEKLKIHAPKVYEEIKRYNKNAIYYIDVIREFGNQFQHNNYIYNQDMLLLYSSMATEFFRDLKFHSPEIVNIISVESNADGYYALRISAKGLQTKTAIYTDDTLKSSYIPLREKVDERTLGSSLLPREAFIFPNPGATNQKYIIAPLICERNVALPFTTSDTERSRLIIEIECETAETPPISPTPLQGED
jgi:hypothetical protein